MKQVINVGAKVQVVNQATDGREFIEGYAVVRGLAGDTLQYDYVYCSVLFDGDDSPVYRWIRKELM